MIIFSNTQENLNKELSPNFKGKEFKCNCGKCNVTIVDPIGLALLQALRNMYGSPVHILSAYRCPAHNEHVKGLPFSFHPQGKAWDLDLRVAELAKKIFPWHYIGEGFIHVDTRGLS